MSQGAATPSGARFARGDVVVLRETLEHGYVVDPPTLTGGEYWYRVRFGPAAKNLPEDQLDAPGDDFRDLQRLAQAGRWGTMEAFRCALALERILNANETTVYSYKAQRILFEPYQYKPLLKILASPDRKLLIADEVGLGKTIEAGLILTELEARQHIDKVLVICPSRLRDKWREELNRKFSQDFQILNASALRDYLQRASDNPAKSRLRGIVSIETLRNATLRQGIDELGALDLVIIDEAHYGRNPETQAAKLVADMSQLGDCALLLTATPLQLKTRDLFTLVSALRPTEFRDQYVFEKTIEQFAGIHTAASLVRSAEPANLARAACELQRVFGAGSRDPLAQGVIRDLLAAAPDTRRAWLDLGRRLEELHPLSTILTRTRKRDVQSKAPVRRSKVFRCEWTPEEAAAYQKLVGVSGRLGWTSQRLSIGQIQRARQAASSIHAAISYAAARVAASDDDATELTDILPFGVDQEDDVLGDGGAGIPDLPPKDSKFEALLSHLANVWQEEPNAKVIIFTFFVGTANYLADRIAAAGHPATFISGKVKSNPRHRDQDERGRRIQRFREEPQIKVMVSTEVGSEGLDFQFCHHLVNYDLPWNPMVVEQRIGRIDRFGQQSAYVQIHSLVVKGTVEDRILSRLYDRIGIFRQSIGDLETILGETVSELQREYIAGRLTPEESDRKVEAAANAIEQRKRDLEELEREAGQLFGHEDFIREEMQRVGFLGRHLTESGLLAILGIFFRIHHPAIRIVAEGSGVYSVPVGEKLAREIRLACNADEFWAAPSTPRMSFTMSGSVAFEHPEIELINASHPLLRAAVTALRDRLTAPEALVGHGTVSVAPGADSEIEEGAYFVVVAAHLVSGVRPRRDLDPVVWSIGRSQTVDPDLGERLLHLLADRAGEWTSAHQGSGISEAIWVAIWDEFRRRNQLLRSRVAEDNAAWHERRRRLIEAEFARARMDLETRIDTARRNDQGPRVINLFQAQLSRGEKRYRERLAELDSRRVANVSLSDAIAACLITVRRVTAGGT